MVKNIHIAALAGAIAPPLADFVETGIMNKNPQGALGKICQGYTGFDPNHPDAGFRWQRPARYYGALALGCVASTLAAKLGVNKFLPKGFNI